MKRPHNVRPCGECPFRRKALPGWLGEATPEEFLIAWSMDYPMPCHSSIDYEEPDWKERWENGEEGRLCAGALIFARNRSTLSRDPDRPRLEKDLGTVFATPQEFLDHHHSWDAAPGAGDDSDG